MNNCIRRIRRRRPVAWLLALAAVFVASSIASGTATGSSARKDAKRVRIAYLSFAVANSYDAPMLAAAKSAAKKGNASITVFDAANDPKKQFAQLQTAASSGQFDAIVAGFFMLFVFLIVIGSASQWWQLIRGTKPVVLRESEFVPVTSVTTSAAIG